MNKKYLVHIHIPKTAGTSVTRYLRSQFGNNRVIHFGRPEETARFRKMHIDELSSYHCIGAHLHYPTLLKKIGPNSVYFTVLRDPFDLYVSFYSDVRKREGHPLHGFACNCTPESFLDYVAAKNLLQPQVNFFSKSFSIDAAIELIEEKKVIVDTLPNLERLLARVAKEFRKEPAPIPHRNSSVRNEIPDEDSLRNLVYELYWQDRFLVEYVEKRKDNY